jgi:phosphoserine phosphatase RsbU/P
MNLIKTLKTTNINGEKIVKICSNTSCVNEEAPVHTLAQELTNNKVPALGVLSSTGKLTGIIVSRTLFELLAKPYGRDLLFRKTASEVMIKPRTFIYDEYISDVHEHLKEDFFLDEIQHYALIDSKKNFKGIFSSKDLLLHIAAVQHQETLITEKIQKIIIPPFLSYEADSFSLVSSSVMSQRIGGDYYHVKKIDKNRIFFCLCDISGKGMSAAILTAVLAGFMETITYINNLHSIVQNLNNLIMKSCSLEKYATGVFCIINETDNTLEYCDMGHGLFYEVRNNSIRQIQENSDNVPAGVMKLDSIISKKIAMDTNSVYIILSDGITEQQNENSAVFPLETIPNIIERNTADLKKIKIDFFESFFLFKKRTIQHDDASVLFFCTKKAP